MRNFFLLLIACMLSAAVESAFATDYHPSTPSPGASPSSNSTSEANASSTSGASTGGIDYYNGGSRNYSLFSVGGATPLPPTTCPKGDSSYVQIAWGLLTVASSTTRTEMDCLEKVLSAMKAQPLPAMPKLPTTDAIHPPVVIPAAAPAKAPKKDSTRAGTTVRGNSGCKHVAANGDVLLVTCTWL